MSIEEKVADFIDYWISTNHQTDVEIIDTDKKQKDYFDVCVVQKLPIDKREILEDILWEINTNTSSTHYDDEFQFAMNVIDVTLTDNHTTLQLYKMKYQSELKKNGDTKLSYYYLTMKNDDYELMLNFTLDELKELISGTDKKYDILTGLLLGNFITTEELKELGGDPI